MEKNRIGLHLIGAVAVSMALVGCADENPWGNTSGEKGSISLRLTTDYDFDTAKPVFRSGEGESGETRVATDLSTINGITVPSKNDFSITLENKEGTYSTTWTTLTEFEQEAKTNSFAAGLYTLTASYGTRGEEGFNKPFFEAETSFNILSGRTREVSLTAELKNSLVQIEYTEAFKNYMETYTVHISTGGNSEVAFTSEITAPAFIQPGEATLSLDFTTKVTGKNSVRFQIGKFEAIAKTLHKIKLDVTPNSNGATLEVIFDDESVEEGGAVSIDLTQDLYSRPAPSITATGFNNGQTIDMKENAIDAVFKMDIFAPDGIKSAILSAEGTSNYKYTETINLIGGSVPAGITRTNFPTVVQTLGEGEKPERVTASLDITNYAKALCQSTEVKEYTLTLKVTDLYDKESEAMSVILNTEDLSMSHIPLTESSVSEVTFGSKNATVNLTYNGADPKNVVFLDENGNQATIERITYNGEAVFSRALETKVYEYALTLPSATYSNKVCLKAYDRNKYDTANTPEEKEAVRLGTFDNISVSAPEYTISVDAFAKYAYLKINTNDEEARKFITQNINISNNSSALTIANDRDLNKGIITVTGLASATKYATLKSKITGWEKEMSITEFTTETEEPIPNGDFSQTTQTINMTNVQVGGTYTGTTFNNPKYHWSSSIVKSTPDDWATINAKTCWTDANNKNTWFCVPSTYVENGKVIIRSVGYDHNGTTPDNCKKTGVYYNDKAPSFGDGKQIAGELFLGSYLFNGTEKRAEGINFSSRPSSVTFKYTYTPLNNETANAEFIVCDASGKEIASASENLSAKSSETTKTLPFNGYSEFGAEAAIVKVKFKSSTASLPAISIPSGTALKEKDGVHLSNETIDPDSYHALAVGSVLTITSVNFNYEYQ